MSENAYLVGLRLAGKKVVMIGGGTVAQRRVPVLISHGADVHVIARAATPAVEALAEQQPGITLTLRDYRDGDLDGAWYAIAATDDPEVNAAVVAEAGAGAFETMAQWATDWAQPCDADMLVARAASVSVVAALAQAERRVILDRVRVLASTHPDLAGRSAFAFPYTTRVSWARRR